jgi:hypothetical protein
MDTSLIQKKNKNIYVNATVAFRTYAHRGLSHSAGSKELSEEEASRTLKRNVLEQLIATS